MFDLFYFLSPSYTYNSSLDDSWIIPLDNTKYQVYNSSFKIATNNTHIDYHGRIELDLYAHSSKDWEITEITIHAYDDDSWMYTIRHCTTSYSDYLPLTNVPAETDKIWVITATEAYLNMKCNGVEVLHFVYDDSPDYECKRQVKGNSVHAVEFETNFRIMFSSAVGE